MIATAARATPPTRPTVIILPATAPMEDAEADSFLPAPLKPPSRIEGICFTEAFAFPGSSFNAVVAPDIRDLNELLTLDGSCLTFSINSLKSKFLI